MKLSINKDIDIRLNILMLSYMKHGNDFWVIKDEESRFFYVNKATIHYSNFSKGLYI
ncbi:hypothetical protein ARSQ2_02478 [Arsenophonus endosymbiont of Bemisia tabaci Q2]|nr:hypothetical protein ARSQ2_00250 [Arsenophonus endosymbiont of Bemisia tabaci Q2]CAA2931325.1 hypothetical protein ARSQ2_02478 [Arsenophonus endosymbiont of Bemisia tabaci Q2]